MVDDRRAIERVTSVSPRGAIEMSQSFAETLSWVPVSRTLGSTLARAHDYARSQTHRTVTLEHVLLALAEDSDAGLVLQASSIDVGRLVADVSAVLGRSDDRDNSDESIDPAADEALVRILDYAAAAARQSRRREINGAIVLAAIIGEGSSVAASLLQTQGLTFEGAIKALQRSQAPTTSAPASEAASATGSPAANINGAATQANEQILARVRRRIDANRAASRASPASMADEPRLQPFAASIATSSTRELAADATAKNAPLTDKDHAVAANGSTPETSAAFRAQAPNAEANSKPPGNAAETSDHSGRSAASETRNDTQHESAGWLAPPLSQRPSDGMQPPPLPPASPEATGSRLLIEDIPSPLRPRQLGAPSVTYPVPWPEPVKPQPQALPSYPAQVAPELLSRAEGYPPDGGIAGPPYIEPDLAAGPPPPTGNLPVPRTRQTLPVASRARTKVEAGQLAENFPRTMRVDQTETSEVRISKANLKALTDGLERRGAVFSQSVVVTKAISIRLRAPDGGFVIETASPETQWIENTLDQPGDDFASWKWHVTPRQRGKSRLQLVVSARTVGSDGSAAETALPHQVIEISIRTDYGALALRIAGWLAAAVIGGVLTRFGQGGIDTIATIWRGFE